MYITQLENLWGGGAKSLQVLAYLRQAFGTYLYFCDASVNTTSAIVII